MANYDFVFNVGANADSFVKDIIEKYKEAQAMITADGLIVKYSGDPKSLKEVINNIRNADPTATITFQADKKSMERILEGVDISGIKFDPKRTNILKKFQDVINAAGKQLDGVNLTGYFTDVTSAFIDEKKSAKELYNIVKRTTDAINMLISSSNKQGLKGLDQNELENIIKKMRERIELEETLQKTSDEIRNKYQKDDEEVRSSVIEKAQKRKYNVGDIKKDRESLGFSDSVYNQLKEKDKDTLNQFIKNTKYLKQEFEKRKQYQDINKDITTTKDAEDLINKRKQLYNMALEIKQQTKDMGNEKLFKSMGLDKILAQINDELEAGISRLINIKTSKIQTNIRNAGNDIDNQLSIYQEKRIKSAGKDLERTQEKAEKNRKKDEKNYGAGRRSKGRSEGGSGYGDGEETGAGGIGGGTGKDSGVTGEFKEATGAAEEFGEAGRAAGQAVASSVREASEAVQDLNRKIKEAEDKLKELQSGVDAKQLKSKDFGGLIQGAIDDAERLIADIDASDDEISKAQQRVLDLAATARSLGEMPRMGEKYDNLYETYQMDNEDYEEKILKKIVDPKAIQEQEELIRKLKSDLEAELSKSGVSGGGHGSITGASKDEIDELQKALSELPDSKEILIKVNNETALPSIEEVETVLDKIPDTKTIKISAIDYDKIPLLSDALGNIIDVYRGMHGVFGSTGKGGISWFADQLEVAAGYADDLQEDGKIIKANLAFKNPLEVMGNGAAFDKLDMSEMSSEFKEAAKKMGFDVKKMVTDDVVAVAKSIGRDGVIFRDIMDSYGDVVHNVYATIDQIQVKNEELRGIVRKNTGELELLDKTDNSQSPSSTILSQQQIYGDIQDAINSHEYTFVAKLDKEASNIGIDIQDEIDSHSPYRTKVGDDKQNKDLDINKEVSETPASKFVEQAKKNIEETRTYVDRLNSDVQRMDPDGIVSRYLFGENGIKSKQQLVNEIQDEVKTIDDALYKDYLNGRRDIDYEKELSEPFKKLKVAQNIGPISYTDKILPDSIQQIYDQWFRKDSAFPELDRLDDDQMSFWGGMIDAQERLNVLQKNGGQDYIEHLQKIKQLSDEVQEARERNATFQETAVDTSELTQEQANARADEILKEKASLDQLISSVEEYRSKSREFHEADSWFGNYLPDTSGLKTMSDMLEDEVDTLKSLDILRNRKQDKIYSDAVDYKFKGKHGAPKELEDYWEQLDDTFYPREGLAPFSGEEAIEKLNQKAKDLGVTFDETQKKWVELSSSTEIPQTPDNEEKIAEEGEAAEKAKQQKEDFAKANEHVSQATDSKPIEETTDKIDDEGEAAKKAKKEKEDFADANEKIADVTDAGSIEQASDAINDEAESASKAKKEKEEFAKANEHVADSANETAEETKDAIKDIENESEAVDKGGWGSDQITELLGNISHLKETIDGISTSFTDFAGSLDVSGAIEGMQNLSEAIDEVKGKIESLTTATEGLDLEGLGKAFGKEEITQSLTNTLDKLEEVKGVFSQGFGLGEAGAEAPINNLITAFERLARILEIIQAKGKIDIDLGEDAQQVSDNLNTDKDKADTKNKKNITNETGTKMKQVLDEIYEENQRLGIPKITIEQWQRVLAVAGKYKDQLGDIVDIHRSMLDQNDETSTRYDIKTTNGTFRVYDSGAVKDSAKMGDLLSEQKAQEKQAADAEKKLHQYSSAVKDVVKAQEALDFSKAADKSVLVERLDDAKKKAAELREELTSVVHAIELLSNERKSSLYKELAESLSIEGDPTKATSYQSKANNEKLSDAKKKLKAYEDAVEKVVKLESQINADDITGKNNLGLVRQLQEAREEAEKTKQELKEVASVFYQEFAKSGDVDYKQKISEINEELSNPKASKMYLEKEYEAIEAAIVDCYKAAKKFEDIQEKYGLGETSKRQLDNARANLDKASKTAEDAYKRLKPDNSDHYNRATGLMDYTRNIKNISPSNIDAGFATEEQAWQTLTKYAERYAKVKQKQSEGNVLNYSDLTFLDKYGEKFNEYINKINTLRSVGATLNEFQQGFVDKLGAAQNSALENYLDRIEHEVEELNDLQVNNAGKEAIDKIKRAWDEAAESVRKYGQESEQAQGKITTYNTLKSDFNDRYKEGYYTGANQKDIETLRRRMNEWLYNNPAATTAAAEFKKMFDEIDRGVSEGRLNELKAQFERVKSEAYEAGEVGQTFAGTLKKSFGGLARYLMTYVSFYDFINMMRQAVNIVKELDTAFTEMRKVSDEPLSVLREFSKTESFDIANQVGTTSQQVQQSTADFLRLGESFEQAKKSAKEATVLLNVSEFSDINEATDALTAMSQAYKQLDKEEIIDKLNYIGNNYSISTSELAQSLEKSAGTLSVAANNFDEAIALTVAGNAVLRDPLIVGQSLKTMSLRMNGTDIQTLEAEGEETEGAITTKSKLRQKIMDLTKVAKNGFKGIDILDENGNYRSTYENLLAIAEVFQQIGEEDKKLGTNRQSALLETLAQTCENIQKYIYRTYLIAGNTLEPFTTITEKSRYDGFTTNGLVVLQRSTVMEIKR